MAGSPLIRPATPRDAVRLAVSMREDDAAECAAVGLTPFAALEGSIESSAVAWALEVDGELLALFGVELGPAKTLLGSPAASVAWALTGRAVEKRRALFARVSRAMLEALLEDFPVLVNFIDARYARALRWAAWLGAEVREAVPFGADGAPFHPVVFRRAEAWAQQQA